MTPLERQFALRKAGYTQRKWAQEHGVAEMSVCHLLQGKMVSERLMKAFAEMIGKDYRKVFPEYYLDPNRRKRKKSKVN